MVSKLSGSVSSYRTEDVNKRYIHIEDVMDKDVSTTMNTYAEANPDVTRTVIERLSKNMDIF